MASLLGMLIGFMLVITYAEAANRYDYFQLVQQWPKGFCHSNSKCIQGALLPNRFSIHGMWPSNFSGQHFKCEGNSFDTREMRRNSYLETRLLSSSWPSYTGLSNIHFWLYEYNTHGRCSDNIFSQTPYFRRVDALFRRYNVTDMLLRSTHQISPGGSYRYGDIVNAIRRGIGRHTPSIMCKSDPAYQNLILQEIIICFNSLANSVVDFTRPSSCARGAGIIDYIN